MSNDHLGKIRAKLQPLENWFFERISDERIVTGVIIFTLGAIFFYWLILGHLGLSRDPSDWADFATYLSGTVGVFVVASTLVVLVRTLSKQRDLIESQNVMLEKQDQQLAQSEAILEIERAKATEDVEIKNKESNNAIVYMIHHFANLENMLERAPDSFNSLDTGYFIALHEKHPALYSAFLLEDDAQFMNFINKIDVDLARHCIGAVVNSKQVFSVADYYVRQVPESDRTAFNVKAMIRQINDETKENTLEAAEAGLKNCQYFLAHAKQLIDS